MNQPTMDTAAYLTQQGWRGAGHSLDQRGRGLTKPLLVARKDNSLGVGIKRYDVHADQWWSRAFDSGLKSLQVGTDQHTGAASPRVVTRLELIGKSGIAKTQRWSGLYEGFNRGETLRGTREQARRRSFGDSQDADAGQVAKKRRKERKREHAVKKASKTKKQKSEAHRLVVEERKEKSIDASLDVPGTSSSADGLMDRDDIQLSEEKKGGKKRRKRQIQGTIVAPRSISGTSSSEPSSRRKNKK